MNQIIPRIVLAATLVLAFAPSVHAVVATDKHEDVVQRAFEFRIAGKVDEARDLLTTLIAKDSSIASAHYEMARLYHYMFVGGASVRLEDVLTSINKAVIIEPDNVIYAYYKAISCFMFAFSAMHNDPDQVKPRITETCKALERVLELKPDYHEATLYLVEIYGLLPAEMGGDSLKASTLASQLIKVDRFYGFKARAVLLPEGSDLVKYWGNLVAMNHKTPEYLVEMGKAYLFRDDPINAEKYFMKIQRIDPSKNTLTLDLARYHIMKVMQDRKLAKEELPKAKNLVESFLSGTPEPVVPLKTYSLGLLSQVETFLGNQSRAEQLLKEAKSLDPYFSRASGIPTLLLFDPPNQVSHHYFSFFSPY